MIKNLVFLFGLFVLASTATNTSAGVCLEYEPVVVSVTGTVVRETHPGPPNYEDITKGDKPETIWVLKLGKSICVNQGSELNEAENDIREIQLVLKPEQYNQYHHLLGQMVSVSGTLFHSHTGHHHKRLLLTTNEIKKSP